MRHSKTLYRDPAMSEVDRLLDRLFSASTTLLGFDIFRGDTQASAEDLAREINVALDQREEGCVRVTELFAPKLSRS